MAKTPKKKYAKAMTYGLIICFFVSLILSCSLVFTWRHGLSTSRTIGGIISDVFEYGFPTGMFFLIFIVLAVVLTVVCMKIYAPQEGQRDFLGRKFWHPTGRQTYGDAHFEVPEEFKDLATIVDINDEATESHKVDYGTILGQLTDDGSNCIVWKSSNMRDNSNIAVVGPSGSGKTYGFTNTFIDQAIRRRESLVITDPDGGIYSNSRGLFYRQGYDVKVINLAEPMISSGWHCMDSLSYGSDVEISAQSFANAVIKNATETGKTDQIYRDGPMLLLKALLLRVWLDPDIPEEEKNIKKVYSYLTQDDAQARMEEFFDETPPEAVVSKASWEAFRLGGPNIQANIMMNLATNLQVLQSNLISTVLSTPDIDLRAPGEHPCAYFCIFPDNDSTFKFIVSLFFTMAFRTLINLADSNRANGKRLNVPVNFLLDEFPSIGVLPDWDQKMSTIRKRGISVSMIFQSLTQIQNNYLDNWNSIMGNCSTWLILGVNDMETAKYFSERVGTATVQSQSEQHKPFEGLAAKFGLRPKSEGEGKRNLLDPYELFELPKNDSVIIFNGHGPIYAHKTPHVLHPLYNNDDYGWKLGDSDGLGDLPPFLTDKGVYNKKERDARRSMEEKVRETYIQEHPECMKKYEPPTGAPAEEKEPYEQIIEKAKNAGANIKDFVSKQKDKVKKKSDAKAADSLEFFDIDLDSITAVNTEAPPADESDRGQGDQPVIEFEISDVVQVSPKKTPTADESTPKDVPGSSSEQEQKAPEHPEKKTPSKEDAARKATRNTIRAIDKPIDKRMEKVVEPKQKNTTETRGPTVITSARLKSSALDKMCQALTAHSFTPPAADHQRT